MNKQEWQKKYQEIVLKTNGGNDDYVVALCQIADAINELDEPKQDSKWQNKWQKLKVRVNKKFSDEENCKVAIAYRKVLTYMQELEGEDE